MNTVQMRFIRDTATKGAKKGLRGKGLEWYVRERVEQKHGKVDWEQVVEFLKVIVPLILALLK